MTSSDTSILTMPCNRICYACGATKDTKTTWEKTQFYLNHDIENNALCGKCYMHIVAYGGRHINDNRRGKPIPWIPIKKGPENPGWKGGRIIDTQGYVEIKTEGEHPRKIRGGYVREHILVMEKYLGRHISRDELIHHINGDKTDNRLENLELMTMAEHLSHHHKGIHNPNKSHRGHIPWNKGMKNQYKHARD